MLWQRANLHVAEQRWLPEADRRPMDPQLVQDIHSLLVELEGVSGGELQRLDRHESGVRYRCIRIFRLWLQQSARRYRLDRMQEEQQGLTHEAQ